MKKMTFRPQTLLSGLKELFVRQPYSAFSITLSSSLFAVFMVLESALSSKQKSGFAFSLFEDVFVIVVLITVGVILTESMFPRLRGFKKAVAMLPAVLIGFMVAAAAGQEEFLPAPELDVWFETHFGDFRNTYSLGYLIFAAALILWACYRRSGEKDFSAYALRVFIRIVLDGITLLIVLLGLVLLNAIVMTLLWERVQYLTLMLVCLIFGLWFCPNALTAMLRGADEPPRFAVTMVRKVMLSLCAAAYAILLVYILKIIATWTFPKNTVFDICAILFFISMPVALMSRNEAENDLWHRLSTVLPALFLPFAAMQALCIGMRISQYGLTTSRYIAVALIVFEVTVCVWHILSRDSVAGVLPVLAVMTALCVLTPKLNCGTLPDILQAKTLRAGLATDTLDTLSQTEFSRLKAAVDYRGSAGSRKQWREAYFTEEEREQIGSLEERVDEKNSLLRNTYSRTRNSLYVKVPSPYPLSLQGYSRLYSVSFNDECVGKEEGSLDMTRIPLKGTVSLPERFAYVDLSDLVKGLYAEENEAPDITHTLDPELYLPDGSLLRFTSFHTHCDTYADRVELYLWGDAFLLVK